jgi:hypothetical protein
MMATWTTPSQPKRIRRLRAKGDGILKIGRELGVGTALVQRVIYTAPLKHPV